MNELLARSFQIQELSPERLAKLHAFERKIERPLTPYEINTKVDLPKHGDISEATQSKLNPPIWKAYERIRRVMFTRCQTDDIDWDELALIHTLDKEVLEMGLDFTDKQAKPAYKRALADVSPFA